MEGGLQKAALFLSASSYRRMENGWFARNPAKKRRYIFVTRNRWVVFPEASQFDIAEVLVDRLVADQVHRYRLYALFRLVCRTVPLNAVTERTPA